MYNFLLGLHNLLRWIILLLLVVNFIRHLSAMNKPFGPTDKRLGLMLMIFAHIQLLIGLYEWFAGAWGLQNFMNNGGEVMRNNAARFFAVEHTVGMIIAIVIITIARGVARKNIPDGKKHRRCVWLYALALLIVVVMIPWPDIYEFGRSLVPWGS